MELQRVIRAEGDEETALEVLGEGIAVVGEEEGIVGEGGHGDVHLGQVVEVLQDGCLPQQDPMIDALGGEEGRNEMLGVTCLA